VAAGLGRTRRNLLLERRGRDVRHALGKLSKCKYCYLGDTHGNGVGVFAAREFQFGDVIVEDLDGDYFKNAVSFQELEKSDIPLDYVMQVGEDAFRIPSGTIEDFTNHSCDPNSGIRMDPRGTIALAIRNIRVHEEITFDYSTWLSGDHFNMECRCGSEQCRGFVSGFSKLPAALQKRYIGLGIVADFALRPDRGSR
jgi:uncharacterized protein